MGRTFNGSTDYLRIANALVTAAPLTISIWFKPTAGSATRTLISIGDTAGDSDWFRLVYDESAGVLDAEARRLSTAEATQAGTTEGAWNHGCAVYASSTSRKCYVNGSGGSTETTSMVPAGLDSLAVGRLERASPVHYFGGDLAEVAIWNVALNDAEVAALASGDNPQTIQLANLVEYWTITGTASPEVGIIGARSLTVNGTSASANHPTIDSYGGGGSPARRISSGFIA